MSKQEEMEEFLRVERDLRQEGMLMDIIQGDYSVDVFKHRVCVGCFCGDCANFIPDRSVRGVGAIGADMVWGGSYSVTGHCSIPGKVALYADVVWDCDHFTLRKKHFMLKARKYRNRRQKFLNFMLLVINYEHVYATQERAYIEAEAEWLRVYDQRQCSSWGAFRNSKNRHVGNVAFYIVIVRDDLGTFHAGTYLDLAQARKQRLAMRSKFGLADIDIHLSYSGRLDDASRLMLEYEINE